MTVPKEELLLCKDCVHSEHELSAKLIFFYGDTSYKCKLAGRETNYTSPVHGKTKVLRKSVFCSNERFHGDCGPSGKNWQPKNKKDLFKLLRRNT